MELALFPIAAILLLLSGVSAPVHASVQQAGRAALMRELLGASAASVQTRRPVRAASSYLAHYVYEQQKTGAGFEDPARARLRPQHAEAWPHAFDRKHFKTRFGFPEGAYLALGPPLA